MNCRHVFLYQLFVTEIHHVVIDHQYIINGKSRNHIGIAVRIAAVQQTVIPLGTF